METYREDAEKVRKREKSEHRKSEELFVIDRTNFIKLHASQSA